MSEIVNIAGYKFVALDRLRHRREDLLRECRERGIKGTILLSAEGINLFLAAGRGQIEGFLQYLRQQPGLEDFSVKESPGDDQPFNRLLVRIKKEIIAFGVDGVDPATRTSPRLKPSELKAWLDQGKPLTLLDVRNNYEVALGTFENAVVADIDHFRQFPEAVERLDELKRDEPVVMFCTGGIRCEKAGPFMEQAGFRSVYQLDGGILQYFEDIGSAHYNGDCFVFDQRVAVDPDLAETDAEVCFACQAVLQRRDLQSPKYVSGVSCPFCFQTPAQKRQEVIRQRHQQLQQVTATLPGSLPYNNFRPLNVPRRFDGYPLIDFLCEFHSHVTREAWQAKIETGRLLLEERALVATDTVRDGQRLEYLIPATVEPDVNPAIAILYEDDDLVVIDKPAPLPMHPGGRFNRNTLTWILGQVYDHQLRAVHRLDANTTGVVVFGKTRKVASLLQPQFENRQVKKTYLAVVRGAPREDGFSVDLPITDLPTVGGGRRVMEGGKKSLTEFTVLSRCSGAGLEPRSLLEARPLTGRTNQIRVHLWHQGMPVVGDPTYLPDRQMAEKQTLSTTDPVMCLHAWKLRLVHPTSRQPVEFEASAPAWAVQQGSREVAGRSANTSTA